MNKPDAYIDIRYSLHYILYITYLYTLKSYISININISCPLFQKNAASFSSGLSFGYLGA